MINQFVNARSYSSQRLGTITWNSFSRSEVRERLLEVMSGGPESLVERGMEKEPPTKAGAGEAVLLGALAKGVNAPTWTFLRIVLMSLCASLLCMLAVASNISGFGPLLHVFVLILVAITLFLLLNWFISEIGIVPVEEQMAELNLTDSDIGHSDAHLD